MQVEHRANMVLQAGDILDINRLVDNHAAKQVFLQEQPWLRPGLLRDPSVFTGISPDD